MRPAAVLSPILGTAKLPLRTAAYTLGLIRGLAAAAIRTAAGDHGPAAPEAPADRAEAPVEEVPTPAVVQVFEPVEPAPEREPEPPHESFVTEPTAVTRDSAHGGRGDDAEIDDWLGEVQAEEDDGPASVVEMLEMGDGAGPLVDESAIKATLSETEILRRAAETPSERDSETASEEG